MNAERKSAHPNALDALREVAKKWLDENYPTDHRPPFGDEKLRGDPAYEMVAYIDRSDVPAVLAEFAAQHALASEAAIHDALLEVIEANESLWNTPRSLTVPLFSQRQHIPRKGIRATNPIFSTACA